MYEYRTRVRYTESNSNGEMSLWAVVDCFQNVFHFECEDAGHGIRRFLKNGEGWFIYFWQIDIARYPKCGEDITIGTFVHEERGSSEGRNFYIRSSDDELIVKANSVWSLVDLSKLQILRVPDDVIAHDPETKLDMEYLSRHIRYDKRSTAQQLGEHTVRAAELDSNRHLNNSVYVKLAVEAMAMIDPSKITRLCVEYKAQAVQGDRLNIFLIREDGIILDFRSDSGDSFAVVKVSIKES